MDGPRRPNPAGCVALPKESGEATEIGGWYGYGHLLVITGYFNGITQSIIGVLLVLITGISGNNCIITKEWLVKCVSTIQNENEKPTEITHMGCS